MLLNADRLLLLQLLSYALSASSFLASFSAASGKPCFTIALSRPPTSSPTLPEQQIVQYNWKTVQSC